jgi:predicted house-cleaning noncanonical NTP pyrophosphatase (MazG superfamily)
MKLIRDNTPNLERGTIRVCETDGEYELALRAKIMEEAAEVGAATSQEELTKELGDLIDVITHFAIFKGITTEAISESILDKNMRKGGFEKRLLLVYDTLENKGGTV